MELDLSNIQEYKISYGPHEGKLIKNLPANYIKNIAEKAPNKRGKMESLLIKEIQYAIEQVKGCDCTHTQACKTCAESKDIDWSVIENGIKNNK